ncbi:hypothetical protein Q5H92_19275 [Hymenobacter sp. M29]|uniref:Uncharacterized protein n=1 Tax=Hymenobacter mellowenesis TaxID=3063995 RepID=A0ABT9AF76_9BACT|nr:hypothetical protein [Hymenobacter sp. M29]MDO7848517.1 hypothetical protein [Hymenobacter sp. M29]
MQLFAGTKPAIRSVLDTPAGVTSMHTWCREADYDFAVDTDRYFCVTPLKGQAQVILDLDLQFEQHELEFGQVLGYPYCCCQQVAQMTEAGIDAYAAVVAHWQFTGDYQLINPSGYLVGDSLISHLPCSPHCKASLALAKQTLLFLRTHTTELRELLSTNHYLISD